MLVVGEARHNVRPVLATQGDEHLGQPPRLGGNRSGDIALPEAHIEENLVIAASSGVKVGRMLVPDAAGQLTLHVRVDVLQGRIEAELPRVVSRAYGRQPIQNPPAGLRRDDAALHQHGGVGRAAVKVVGDERLVTGPDGSHVAAGHEGQHFFSGRTGETPSPQPLPMIGHGHFLLERRSECQQHACWAGTNSAVKTVPEP